MEGRVVIETAVHVLQEVIDRNRRLLAIQLQLDVASRSGQQYVRVALGRHGGENAEMANTAAIAARVDLSMEIP